MKITFASIFFLAALTILFSGTISAGEKEAIKNPTIKDLQGHWEGTLRSDSARAHSYRNVNLRISGTKADYSSETNSYVAKLTVSGEEINITAARRSDTCKLSRESDILVLNCNWDMAANPQKNIPRAVSGTMRLEKKDK
jgi:hypothetical protein